MDYTAMNKLAKKNSAQGFEVAWEDDHLDRKEIAEYFTPIIGSIRQPFVISLNSPYGTGKTFFIRNWKKQLEDEGYKAVYFNAWETDYTEDVLIAFIASIKKQLEEQGDEKSEGIKELAKKGGVYLTRKIIPIVAKGVARKFIDSNTVEEVLGLSEQTDEELIELFGDIAEDGLRKHEAVASSIEAFKMYLSELVQKMTENADHENKKKLIIFVDELDRCRPNYAIEVLECIKHLFSVDGIVFILAIDEEQLRNSIASKFGIRLNGESYLRKFIDWQLNLPVPSAIKYAAYLYNSFGLEETDRLSKPDHYAAFLFNQYGIESKRGEAKGDNPYHGSQALILIFGIFSQAFQLTLREQAQCFTEINLYIRSLDDVDNPKVFLAAMLPVLKLRYRDEISEVMKGQDPETLLEILDSNQVLVDLFEREDYSWHRFRALLHAHLITLEHRRALASKANELSKQPEGSLDEDGEGYLLYLQEVSKYHQALLGTGVRIDGCLALSVYKKFEFAADFVQR